MAQVAAYHRPEDLEEAVDLLANPDRVALAGGTVVNADREPPAIEVVDLQAVGLDGISQEGDRLRMGAMASLDRLADHEAVPTWLAELARAELPSTLRTLATVGGTVAAGGGESVLLAGLLAAGADAEVASRGQAVAISPLADLLAAGPDSGSLITAVTVDLVEATVATTARTPADVPIVAAVAARAGDGTVTVALTGVGANPTLVDPADPTAGLDPPGDFRGSPDYRRHLAATLSARAIGALS